MKKYLAFFKISLKKSLEYRARSFIWLFWDIGPALIMLFFWTSVFQTRNLVAGYDFYSMAVYYFVVMFSRNLILTHPDEALQLEIYSGQISTYLLKPANLIGLKIFYGVAYKVFKLVYLAPLLLIFYFIFIKGLAISFDFKLINISFFGLSLLFSFCLYFLIKFLIGITAFWFTEIDWLTGLHMLVFWFFGGVLLPLDLMPKIMQNIASFLPFKYIFYIPAQGLIGKLSGNQMIFSFLIQIFWLVLFFILTKKVYKSGLKAYSAFGG
ncbi:ABC transporter permease [Patescibacteria group bacterium]